MSWVRSMSKGRKILYGILIVYVLGLIGFAVAFGIKGHKNESFKVIDAFHLETWFHIAGPLDFNKGVLYLLIATLLTLGIMLYVARHMQQASRAPAGRGRDGSTASCDQVTRENMDAEAGARWFPFISTLFVFILVSNLIGYIPLPVDSAETFKLFGAHIPSFQIYAADHERRRSRWCSRSACSSRSTYEGVTRHGPIGYIKSLMPGGVKGAIVGADLPDRDPLELPAA